MDGQLNSGRSSLGAVSSGFLLFTNVCPNLLDVLSYPTLPYTLNLFHFSTICSLALLSVYTSSNSYMDGSYIKVSTVTLLFCFGLGMCVFDRPEVVLNNLVRAKAKLSHGGPSYR